MGRSNDPRFEKGYEGLHPMSPEYVMLPLDGDKRVEDDCHDGWQPVRRRSDPPPPATKD